jgi:hypothetical protein
VARAERGEGADEPGGQQEAVNVQHVLYTPLSGLEIAAA